MKKLQKLHIGPRIWKTAGAVVLSLLLAQFFGATDSRLIYAMLGAMGAMEPTFKASLEACLTQILGVFCGAWIGIFLQALPIPGLLAAGIGIVVVITLYNVFGIRFSPGLPCLMVVSICTSADSNALMNAAGRIWDTAIGLAVGMAINTLVFPYDNRRQIRATARSLDKQVIAFLEDMFDGDDHLPDADAMAKQIGILARQLAIFTDQRFLLGRRQQNRDLETFRLCEQKARELLARMTVLSQVERIGRLNEENRRRLTACGANIQDARPLDAVQERDVVTNYHVRQILKLRRELLEILNK